MAKKTLIERLMDKVEIVPGGCWVWKGKKNAGGYGCLTMQKKYFLAHRLTYTYYIGGIPSGLVIDHLCRNHACVNPIHLEAVTQRENTLRGKTVASENSKKTHCINGHPLGEGSEYYKKRGWRTCLTCRRLSNEKAKRKQRAQSKTPLNRGAFCLWLVGAHCAEH